MPKVFWLGLLACAVLQPAQAADLTSGGRPLHGRGYVQAYVRRVELIYPRTLAVVNDGYLITPRYACWAAAPDGRLRLVPLDGFAPCVSWPHYQDRSDVRFVEHVRTY